MEYYFARAKCYFEQGEYHKYVFDISLAIHVEPTNFVLHMARSHGLFKLAKYTEALTDLQSASKHYEDYQKSEDKKKDLKIIP